MNYDIKRRATVERALLEYRRRLMLALDAAGAPKTNEDGIELLTPEARIEAMGTHQREKEWQRRRVQRALEQPREMASVENGLLPAPRKARRAKR
jgi:threonine dehydrogenase-like Zn-dependent dehydrogenase